MFDFEKRFDAEFENEFAQLPSGKWYFKKDKNKSFICSAGNTPVKEFKQRYPQLYREELDNWFDTVHNF